MLAVSKFLTGTAGLALVAGAAAPAAAQSYPYGGYGYGNPVGQVINQVLGGGAYGQYGQGNDRVAVDQCARAAQARVSRNYNQGYNNQGYGQETYGNYPNAYRYNNAGVARVVGITNVERKSYGLKVYGLIASGRVYPNTYGNQGYGQPGYGQPGYGNQAYAYNNQVADLRFSCKVDYRGYVSDIDIKRNNQAYRGY